MKYQESAKNRLWIRLVDELDALRVSKVDNTNNEAILNPISGDICLLDTASAALVFATEYVRTCEDSWRSKAISCIDFVKNKKPFSGLDEPQWSPAGWVSRNGSLYMTGATIDMLWSAQRLLNLDDTGDEQLHPLSEYLASCMHQPGVFAHDSIPKNSSKISDVQNTTAIGLYLLRQGYRQYGYHSEMLRFCYQSVEHLSNGMRYDGFWPYIYPGKIQKSLYRVPQVWDFKAVTIFERYFLGDKSIRFGDVVHHLYIMYFLAKSAAYAEDEIIINILSRAWNWLRSILVYVTEDDIRIDFSVEPELRTIRFCNFSDTTAYFILLATLPDLKRLGLLNDCDRSLGDGIINYVIKNLLGNKSPAILPHEDVYERRAKILPAIWQSSAWKAALLSGFIRMHYDGPADSSTRCTKDQPVEVAEGVRRHGIIN